MTELAVPNNGQMPAKEQSRGEKRLMFLSVMEINKLSCAKWSQKHVIVQSGSEIETPQWLRPEHFRLAGPLTQGILLRRPN